MSTDKTISDSSASGSMCSTSASEGEYTLPIDDLVDSSTSSVPTPRFDVSDWAPEPPAGLQYLSLLPLDTTTGYTVASDAPQHELKGRTLVTAGNRKQRQREYLRGRGVGRNVNDEKRLRAAVSEGNFQRVEDLLDSGIEPSCMDDKKRSPLHLAASTGNKEIVELLLDRGANPNQRDIIGNTALHLAACTNHFEVVTLLLRAGTDVNAEDNTGHTPLHLARSRLRMIQDEVFVSSDRVKHEVANIIAMMKEYLDRSGQTSDLAELDSLCDRLSHTATREEVGALGGLLETFASLQIEKKDRPG